MRKAAILVAIAALSFAAGALDVKASQPYNPTFDIISVLPIDLLANADVNRKVTVSTGDHVPAIEILSVPPGWDIAADAAVPDNDIVGSVFLQVDQGCDTMIDGFVANILDKPADPGDKAHWTAFLAPSLVFDFTITGDSTSGHTITALLFSDPAIQGPYCSLVELTIAHKGVSSPSLAAVFTNPSTQGVKTWSSELRSSPLPAEHIVTLTDDVAIGTDTDGDGVPDFMDNCPNVPNGPFETGQLGVGNQTDLDGDGLGDACDPDDDDDGLCDPGQSDPSCTGSDTCQFIAEDFDSYQDGDGCPEPDNDGDGIPDATDDCPGSDATAGPDGIAGNGDDDPITAEDVDGVLDSDGCPDPPGADFDGDGWTDDVEALFLITDAALCCSGTDTPNDEDPNPCPPDFNDNQLIGIDDVFFVSGRFNASTSDPDYAAGAELASQDGLIGIDDIFAVSGRFNQAC